MADKPVPTAENLAELAELVARYDAHVDYYTSPSKNYNEHSCRDEFINELLGILGWDVGNVKGVAPQYREVIAENYSSNTERPDYTMTVSGQPCFFVEAKKPSVSIIHEVEPALQARKYGWNARHNISVLTNFEDLVVYDACVMPKAGDAPSTARYRRYNHSEYVECFDEIYALLSRESVFGGYYYEFVESEFPHTGSGKERVDDVFLGQINEWRLAIAQSLLSSSDRFKDEELLNDSVQDFINQIVFLRICEDKNLPVYHKLSELDESDVGSSLMELLRAADKRYNSGMFSRTSTIRCLDEKVVIEIVKALYYPQSPYLFDIIDSNIFGQIYEMFLSEYIVVDDGSVHLARKREYKDRSVVATPVEIARYIVDCTLRPLCEGKTLNQIKNLRCADIACGSGIFLLEAFQFLMDRCLDWMYENDRDQLVPMEGGRYKLPLSLKKEILVSCLYGIDIDTHAVEVAKFSLLTKLIEEETAPTVEAVQPILPNLDDNIVVGNALVSPSEAREVCANSKDLESIIPLDWSLINDGEPFDAIVGNPPYVKTEDLHTLLPNAEFKAYTKAYKSSHRQFDKYFLFIERALGRLTDGGYACFIVPNKFFKIASGKMLRKVISAGQYLTSLDDFGDAQLFEDKTIYSSIVRLQKSKHAQFTYSSVATPSDLRHKRDEESVILDSSTLDDKPWKLSTDIEYLKQLKALEAIAVPITKHVEFFNGIQTSAERKRTYWFLHSEIVIEDDNSITFARDGQEWTIERSILRPFFKPTEEHGFNSYSALTCDKWIIFPYDMAGHLLPINAMEKSFPGAWRYLLSRKNELWPRQLEGNGTRDVPNATEQNWYQYGRTQHLTSFNGREKVIIGILSREPLYYIDRNYWVIAAGGTAGYCAARIKTGSPYSLEYIQAWLTNENTEKIFEMIGSDFEGGFKSRGTSLLKTLPFIELDFNKPKHVAIHDEVTSLSKRIQQINENLLNEPSRRREIVRSREKNAAIKRITELINGVYALEDF